MVFERRCFFEWVVLFRKADWLADFQRGIFPNDQKGVPVLLQRDRNRSVYPKFLGATKGKRVESCFL